MRYTARNADGGVTGTQLLASPNGVLEELLLFVPERDSAGVKGGLPFLYCALAT